jgi:hypothetical protein
MSPPEVPVNVTVAVAATAVRAALSFVFCGVPGVKVNVAGLAVTPAGSPEIVIATAPLNEFVAVAVTPTEALTDPPTIVTDVGVTLSV